MGGGKGRGRRAAGGAEARRRRGLPYRKIGGEIGGEGGGEKSVARAAGEQQKKIKNKKASPSPA